LTDAVRMMEEQTRREEQMAELLMIRLSRAGLYALTTYILLWLQNLFDGSYFLAAAALAILSMVSSAQRVVQVAICILFVSVLLSSPISKAVDVLL
jgi:hypothetical protein